MAFFSGLVNGFRRALDPTGLSMSQALLAGDYGAAAEMAQRFRHLQAEHERAASWARKKRRPGLGPEPELAPPDDDVQQPLSSWHSDPDPGLALSGIPELNLASAQDGFHRSQEHELARQCAERTGRNPDDCLREMRGLPPLRSRQPRRGHVSSVAEEAVGDATGSRTYPVDDPVFQQKLRRGGGLNDHSYVPTERDLNLFARALFSEFGTIPSWQDMRAGGWTIINRIRPNEPYRSDRHELGRTLREVLERRNPNGSLQYSFMPPGGVDAPGGSRQWRLSARPEELTGDDRKAWDLAVSHARELLSGGLNDPTGGTIFFRHRTSDPRSFEGMNIVPSAYRSPTDDNLFFHHGDEPARPLPFQKPIIGSGSPRPGRQTRPRR